MQRITSNPAQNRYYHIQSIRVLVLFSCGVHLVSLFRTDDQSVLIKMLALPDSSTTDGKPNWSYGFVVYAYPDWIRWSVLLRRIESRWERLLLTKSGFRFWCGVARRSVCCAYAGGVFLAIRQIIQHLVTNL